jgi:nickel-dependent lactate racemase
MEGNYIEISYGNAKKLVRIPNQALTKVLQISDPSPLENPQEAIKESLKNPCHSKSLQNLVKPGDKVVMIVPDITRPIPLKQIVPVILDELLAVEISYKDIVILIALGTHRPMTEEEIKNMLGEEVIKKVKVINHNWADNNQIIDMGITPLGTPIKVNRLVFEADFIIGIGSVKPHRSAGWSGGGKIIDPGVCGSDTIGWTHWRSVKFDTLDIMGKVDNPIRKEIEKVAQEVGINFIINVVLNRNDEIAFVSSGHFIYAHRKCVEFAENIYRINVPEKADILIAGTGPWATDFWAAGIILFTAEFLVKNNGTVVLFARCPDGIAPEHPDILKYGFLEYKAIRDLVNAGQLKDLCAASCMAIVSKVIHDKGINCILFSDGVSESIARKLGLSWAKSPQDALDQAFLKYKNNQVKTYIITGDNIADNLVLPR